ncbi:hypothetical protein C8F04DRAFT_1390105 [Mycena alexandri]|uniref:Uncharacterized protein n=1 Tax=Mycena alexandri TaxID=1745969 RepID=A0AAD6TB69_9AGAR|nr:hypothetical protein C8F04DRAFT_1390105 [Mycena alexandri]
MWTKLSSALKSKQSQEGDVLEQPTEALAGPSGSPTKRRVFHRDDGSLRLHSPLKLASIPKKVKSTFNLHGNSSQLTFTTTEPIPESPRDLARRSSQDVLSTSRPKAARRSSFNILTRRPSLDLLRSPPETPRSARHEEPSSISSNHTRNRAATFGGGDSVRSILREPNTPGPGKSVRFNGEVDDAGTLERSSEKPLISRSTPPEDTFLDRLQRSGSTSALSGMLRPSRSSRPTVAEIFSPFNSLTDPPTQEAHRTNFFGKLDVAPISPLNSAVSNNDLPEALSSTPYKDDGGKGSNGLPRENLARNSRPPQLPAISHDRSASFSFGQTVFYPAEDAASHRSSSGDSSMTSGVDSDITSASSSPSVGRSRSISDSAFMSMLRGSTPKNSEAKDDSSSSSSVKDESGTPEPDPFSVNARTYYTPQTMIPTTPPETLSRHSRRPSKEESVIFTLQTQLDLQTELCGQFENDLRARDALVEMLGKKLAEAEEEDAKKRKFLRAWKKKVGELERTCRFLEEEVEGSRQENMDRSVMDEASGEALRMLHRQIAGLEREREGFKRTEIVLREELRRLEMLAGEKAAKLRESLGSQTEREWKQKEQEQMLDELKGAVAALEKSRGEEKQGHEAAELAWQAERDALRRRAVDAQDGFNQQLTARDDEIATLKAQLAATADRADNATKFSEAAEAGKCALAMERDSLKLQVVNLQTKNAAAQVACSDAERKAFELEDDLQGLWETKNSLEQERDQLKERIREEEGRLEVANYKLKTSENILADLDKLRREMSRMSGEHSAALETALQDGAKKQLEIDAQATSLFELKVEIERLTNQTWELQQESADKEVLVAQITKQRAQDKQDLEGLNIALDSKQQELELLKRRLGVRGTAGNTPPQSSKPTQQRRESVSSIAPRMSRPSSFTSEFGVDLGRERKASAESVSKIPALNKSTRLSSSTSIAPTPSKSVRGSMGPPPLRTRSSIVGTPTTVTSRTLTRSSSATVIPPGKTKAVKSPTKTNANPTSPKAAATQGEKENANANVTPASRRLSRIPTLAQ